jgi:hypothetical protein
MGRWIAGFAILCGLVYIAASATNAAQEKPQESYKGPIAEAPTTESGDFWVYVRPDGTKFKRGTDSSRKDVNFPLWIGKRWSYEIEINRVRSRSLHPVTPTRSTIDCEVASFESTKVAAGTFEAFQCKCQCERIGGGRYGENCGNFAVWYAPAVNNVVRVDTDSTEYSYELAEYNSRRRL